jgi:tetratricopeptide (TPR) repeat protein
LITTLNFRSVVALYRGDYELARACLEEAAAVGARLGDPVALAMVQRGLGGVAFLTGDLGAARRLFAESLEGYRDAGNTLAVGLISANLAEALRLLGQPEEARELLAESLRLSREADATSVEAYASLILGRTLADAGRLGEAGAEIGRAVELNDRIGNEGGLVEALENGVRLLARAGEQSLALRVFAAAARHRDEHRSPLQPVYEAEFDRLLSCPKTHSGDTSPTDAPTLRAALAIVAAWLEER